MTMEKEPTSFRIIDMEILNPTAGALTKTAAIALPPGEVYDHDFMYGWVRAVSAGEFWGSNRNADFFPEPELIKCYPTFMQAHVFKNHENKQVEKAIGNVIKAAWNDPMKYVELLIKTSRVLAPEICHNVEKGLATDVSMGCKVKYSVCSICGNVAKTRQDFCEHIEKQRNEIYPDGRIVCEINYNPNFHDISWVLRGADGTAKNLELLAALHGHGMEKAASGLFVPTMRAEVIKVIDHVAPPDEADEAFAKAAATSKQAVLRKFGEMEKILRSKIISLSGLQQGQRFHSQVDDVVHLIKMLYTNYWDVDRAAEIADTLKRLAAKNAMPIEHAFERFVNITELLGITLSPLEIDRILARLCGCADAEREDAETGYASYARRVADPLMYARQGEAVEERFAGTEEPMPAGRLAALYSLMQNPGAAAVFRQLHSVAPPVGFRMVVMRLRARPELATSAHGLDGDLVSMLKPDMPGRSHYAAYLLPRMAKIASGAIQATRDGLTHFAPIHKTAQPGNYDHAATLGYIYGQYQAGRTRSMQSESFCDQLDKYAALLEGRAETLNDSLRELGTFAKTAAYTYPFRHRLFYGTPAIYAFSKWQRSRLNNDENLTSFQRFGAENPQFLHAVNLWLGGKIFRNLFPARLQHSAKGALAAGTNKLRNAGKNIARLVSLADEIDDALEKTASNPLRIFATSVTEALAAVGSDEIDIFLSRNPVIETGLEDKAGWVKAAALYYELGREDAVAEIQRTQHITDSHIATYVENMRRLATAELTKIAGGVVGRMVDGSVKSEWLSGFPGLIVNAHLVNKIAGLG